MIIKTSELEGAALDWAVAKALDKLWYNTDGEFGAATGWLVNFSSIGVAVWDKLRNFSPSTNWSHGGPLIAEKVTVTVDTENGCYADCGAQAHAIKHQTPLDEYDGNGPTILIACMRAIVAAELGETADVPEELIK